MLLTDRDDVARELKEHRRKLLQLSLLLIDVMDEEAATRRRGHAIHLDDAAERNTLRYDFRVQRAIVDGLDAIAQAIEQVPKDDPGATWTPELTEEYLASEVAGNGR